MESIVVVHLHYKSRGTKDVSQPGDVYLGLGQGIGISTCKPDPFHKVLSGYWKDVDGNLLIEQR